MRAKAVLTILWAMLLLAAPASLVRAEAVMERSELVVETETGAHRFSVELARTPEERARGLMFRERLPADAGMLFVYDRERAVSMWMKNTLIPLDMLFIGSDGRIVAIVERTVPMSTKQIAPNHPARAVLELNGGTADRLGIAPGDRVRHALFDAE